MLLLDLTQEKFRGIEASGAAIERTKMQINYVDYKFLINGVFSITVVMHIPSDL